MASKVDVGYNSSETESDSDVPTTLEKNRIDKTEGFSVKTGNKFLSRSPEKDRNGSWNSDTNSSGMESDSENNKDTQTHRGLANVMTKILTKTTAKKKVILAKGKTDRELLQRKRKNVNLPQKEDFEVVGENASKTEKPHESSSEEDDPEELRQKRLKKKLWEDMGRVKPQVLDKEKERSLQKIATRGVVQLFNAVKKQQKTIEEKLCDAGPSERRKDQVLKSMTKGQFLDVLKGTAPASVTDGKTKAVSSAPASKEKANSDSTASFLREDFMMGAKMRDWDKESDGQGGSEEDHEMITDSDT